MLDATMLSSLSFALIAGVATFFSPCAYPLLPGYVGYYASRTDGKRASLSGAFSRGVVAGIGVLATLGVLFGVAFRVGHATLSNIIYLEPIVGLLLVIFGLIVLFLRTLSVSLPLPKRRTSVFGFLVFGAGYALAAAGCVAPLFTGVVARALSMPVVAGALVAGTYIGSIVVLMVSLTVATGMGLVANTGRFAAYSKRLEQLAAVVMVLAGIGQLYLSIVVLDVDIVGAVLRWISGHL